MAQTAAPDTTPETTPAAVPPDDRRRLRPVRSGLIAAAAFVLGLLVGAVTVGLLAEGPAVVSPPGAGAAPTTAPDTGPLPDEDASAEFVVSGACFGAVNAAEDTLLLVDDIGTAATDLDAARLDEIVRRLMPLQDRLERGVDACRVDTVVEGGTGPGSAEPGGDKLTD